MPKSPKTTWIVIADGARARILAQKAPRGALLPALDQELVDPAVHGHSRDIKSDAPGRAFDPGSGARHAMEPRHDPHQYEKHLFAKRVAELINAAAGRKEFNRLVLVAPPKTLGDLRAELDEHAAKMVTGTLDRDLLKIGAADLPRHLESLLD